MTGRYAWTSVLGGIAWSFGPGLWWSGNGVSLSVLATLIARSLSRE